MRVALWLPRLNMLRMLGPIAAAATRRGWAPFFLCPFGGPKDDAVVDLARVQREGGAPASAVAGATATAKLLTYFADAVVAVGLRLPEWARRHVVPETRRAGVRWVSVGYLQEELLHVLQVGPAILGEWDLVTTASQEGVDFLAAELAPRGLAASCEAWRRFVPTGYPALDPLIGVDRAACRGLWGFAPDQRVLLFVPPARPHLMARWRWWAFAGALGPLAAAAGWLTYRQIALAVRRFSERHGATVVVKARAKTPPSRYLPWLGRVVTDERYHPSTMLKLAVAADAYAGVASAAAVEATAAGLFQTHFLAWPPEAAEHPFYLPFRRHFYLRHGPWRCPLVSEALDGRAALWRWAEEAPWPGRADPGLCRAALHELVGDVDGKASDRVLDALAALP